MSTNRTAERVRSFGTSIFAEISALAVQHGAVNLGQGFPDFAGPEWVKSAAAEAIAADQNQYPPYLGLPRLREAIAAAWRASGWREVDPASEVTVTSGATEAIFGAVQALINPGDEVIVFEPFYDAYVPDVVMAGGVPRYVRLHPPLKDEGRRMEDEAPRSDNSAGSSSFIPHPSSLTWHFDLAELAAAFSPRTRLLLLNTPHNPTGKVFSPEELAQIAALCIAHDVVVIADEVYEHLVFGGAAHTPIATLPGMWERTLTVNSTGKTFSLTGWKIGYAVGPADLTAALRAAHQWITFSTSTPLQSAAAVALEQAAARGYYAELRAEYDERRALLVDVLRGAGLPTLPVEGSYFVMADISQAGFSSDADFCRWLTRDVGVAAIPPSAFYRHPQGGHPQGVPLRHPQGGALRHPQGVPLRHPQGVPLLARFCFAKKLETLRAAADRLATVGKGRGAS
ncbi:aminotransferase class I/II-fold pyridoxal phosphate-dependent enzyme [Oscillochloris sp. ZM17-4]|uniref:aminotransferase class I/II-fold pyridoxal phosphate-dependent enzyme n=1 Tax=Oscillochloris sp. ZM17-4 TaxID=2866714 RepID=UPI001C72B502|nr:aminotransferase class I/II-fold pyridoxal phosphate-dependent enzyme [Oscillochloris sp. ZM17-4]MBX0330356.1 aminotransferase class I/II-fold pyridoxal phosphate-dependent enzyme [Oscillochloris sp. ZM17-4]